MLHMLPEQPTSNAIFLKDSLHCLLVSSTSAPPQATSTKLTLTFRKGGHSIWIFPQRHNGYGYRAKNRLVISGCVYGVLFAAHRPSKELRCLSLQIVATRYLSTVNGLVLVRFARFPGTT